MNLRNSAAFLCIAIPTLVELALGVIYCTAREPMAYHQEILGVGWTELPPGVRILLTGLVNAYGSAHLAVGIALSVLLLVPLRAGEAWARWAILAVGLPVLGGTACISAHFANATGANVPWRGAVVLLVLFVVGVALFHPPLASMTRGGSESA